MSNFHLQVKGIVWVQSKVQRGCSYTRLVRCVVNITNSTNQTVISHFFKRQVCQDLEHWSQQWRSMWSLANGCSVWAVSQPSVLLTSVFDFIWAKTLICGWGAGGGGECAAHPVSESESVFLIVPQMGTFVCHNSQRTEYYKKKQCGK